MCPIYNWYLKRHLDTVKKPMDVKKTGFVISGVWEGTLAFFKMEDVLSSFEIGYQF